MDIKGKVTKTPSKIGSCSQQDVELHIEELWVVSQAASQLPLLIEDASRPIKADDEVTIFNLMFCKINIMFILNHYHMFVVYSL